MKSQAKRDGVESMTVHDAHLHLHAEPEQQQQWHACTTPDAAHRVQPAHTAVRGGLPIALAHIVLDIIGKNSNTLNNLENYYYPF